jgi:hypothetical protein
MRAEDLLKFHIRNLHEKLGAKWYSDTDADIAAIITLMKAEIKEEIMLEIKEILFETNRKSAV